MRLVTYSNREETRLGAMLDDTNVVDLNRASGGALPHDMLAFLELGESAMEAARKALSELKGGEQKGIIVSLDSPEAHLEAPVMRPGKVLAIGLNYRDHAEESGQELPKRPIVFSKVSTCITGPGMPVQRPRVSRAVDWEGELCFVIGRRGRHISADKALEYVAGYTIGNDVSVRDWQFHSATWMMGKGFDTHGPLGPWLVTRDEIPDPHSLDIRTWVNGELKQSSNTRNLIFGVEAIIEYVSTAFTLEPGDVVYTGTPAGVGSTRNPREWLQAGDVVRVEIEGIGVLENPVIEEP